MLMMCVFGMTKKSVDRACRDHVPEDGSELNPTDNTNTTSPSAVWGGHEYSATSYFLLAI